MCILFAPEVVMVPPEATRVFVLTATYAARAFASLEYSMRSRILVALTSAAVWILVEAVPSCFIMPSLETGVDVASELVQLAAVSALSIEKVLLEMFSALSMTKSITTGYFLFSSANQALPPSEITLVIMRESLSLTIS